MTPSVSFTPEKLARLRARLIQAIAAGEDSFMFDGREYLTRYAQYVVEYLTAVFARQLD